MPNCLQGSVVSALPVWARPTEIKRLTGVPEKWLVDFRVRHPDAVRKFGTGHTNGTLVFNVQAVLAAIDAMGGEVRS